jgi:hypothetical protein
MFGLPDKSLDRRGTIEKAVVAVAVQVDKRVVAHCHPRTKRIDSLFAKARHLLDSNNSCSTNNRGKIAIEMGPHGQLPMEVAGRSKNNPCRIVEILKA